jgi:hypothetical protein
MLQRRERSLLFLGLLGCSVFLAGCGDLLSLYALYTPNSAVFDASYEGKWENKDNVVTVMRADGRYEVALSAKGPASETSKFEMHLVDLHGVRFADLLPEDHIGHMILRVKVEGQRLHVAFMDSDWLRGHVPHEQSDVDHDRKQAVLIQRTPQLAKLVAKYALEERAYDKEIVFERQQ